MNGTRWTRNPDAPTREPMRPRTPDARYLNRSQSRLERDSKGGAR